MLVWHDTQKRRQALPSWLPPAPQTVRVHSEHGDLLCVGTQHAMALGWREDAEWVEAGEGWNCAVYLGDPCIGDLLRKDQNWTLVGIVLDGIGREWSIPCILHPIVGNTHPGPPIVAQSRRLTAEGWKREPLHEIQRAALDACASVWPHLGDIGTLDLDQQGSAICAILEATHHVSGPALARLGLIDDVIVEKGIKLACGWLDPRAE